MKKPPFREWPFILLLGILAVFHLAGASEVPFHPDEATYLYMSSDVDALLTRPASLAWTPASPDDPKLTYRLLSAPLTRDVLHRRQPGVAAVPCWRAIDVDVLGIQREPRERHVVLPADERPKPSHRGFDDLEG